MRREQRPTPGARRRHQPWPASVWSLAVLLVAMLLAGCNPSLPVTPQVATPTNPGTTPPVKPVETTAIAETPIPRPSDTPAPTPTPASRLQIDPAELAGQPVLFWHTWSGPAQAALDRLVAEFNQSNEWGITVVASPHATLDDLYTAVDQAQGASSVGPDLALAYPHQALAWEADGGLVDLNDYVNDPIWGLSAAEQADFYPAFWNQDLSGEKRFGFPAQRSGQMLYYNRTWAHELGFTQAPGAPDEFRTQACAAHQARLADEDPANDHTGGYIASMDYPTTLGWFAAFGAEFVQPGGRGYGFETDEVRATFTFLRTLLEDGCAWLTDNPAPDADFAYRRGLFAAGSLAGVPYQEAAMRQAGNRDEWIAIPFPAPDGDPAIQVFGPSYVVFPSTPEKQLAAWLFVRWLAQPANGAQLAGSTATYPLRAAAAEAMSVELRGHPAWGSGLALLPWAHPEPALRSWNTVRWAVADATIQLYRYYFTVDQVPDLAELLDDTAADLHAGPVPPTSIPTPTNTSAPTSTATPTATPAPTATAVPTSTGVPTGTETPAGTVAPTTTAPTTAATPAATATP